MDGLEYYYGTNSQSLGVMSCINPVLLKRNCTRVTNMKLGEGERGNYHLLQICTTFQDFSTSFISESDNEHNTIQSHQINYSWEKRFFLWQSLSLIAFFFQFISMHPYLFFNKNRASVTHVGMHLTKTDRGQIQLKDDYKNEDIPVRASQEVLVFLQKDLKMPLS